MMQATSAATRRTTATPVAGRTVIRSFGAGCSQEPGTAFGSRWTEGEREVLVILYAEHGRRKAVRLFVAAYPHRTAHGALYQIDRNLTGRAE